MTIATLPETPPAFARVRFIMVHPSHPGNVGAAARAVKTMGFQNLTLVAPRFADVATQAQAQALASGATDVLRNMLIVDTLAQALADSTYAFALTARPRELGPPSCDIRTAAVSAAEHLAQHPGGEIALVLGTERSGLENDDIALCQRVCHIPANPLYNSLNVAQALQLVAWEVRYALIAVSDTPLLPPTPRRTGAPGDEPAASAQVQALLAHWEEALIAIEFLDPAHPKKLMLRMRHLLTRSGLSNDETDMLRGMCTAMVRSATKS